MAPTIDISHPPKEQMQDLEYCIDSNPSWVQTIILAFQHYTLMLGTSVMIPTYLVPLMGGTNGDKAKVIQALLFVAGIKTLLQTLFGSRLPAVVGSSYAFMIPILSIIGDSSLQRIPDPHERFIHTMRAIQGAVIIGSSLQIILGFSQLWGIFSRFFSPLNISPVICLIGLGQLQRGFPEVAACAEIGIPMLLMVVGLSLEPHHSISNLVAVGNQKTQEELADIRHKITQVGSVYWVEMNLSINANLQINLRLNFLPYLRHIKLRKNFPVFERFSVLVSIMVIWTFSFLLTVVGTYNHASAKTKTSCRADSAHLLSSTPWIKLPYPLEWGPPTFNAGHSFAIMAAVIVSQIESTAAYIAASRFAMATPPPAHVLSRGIGWQGVGMMLDGLFGTVTGSSVSIENVGLLGLTRIGSRRVIQISAGFMIFFSILGKFGALFASIPFPIFAAVYCVLFGLITSLGLSFLQFTNMNSMRNLFITGLSLFLGLSVSQYFMQALISSNHGPVNTRSGWFDGFVNAIFSSAPTVALFVAVLLDNTVDVKVSKKDRGMPWWEKFRNYKGDIRNEEFYALPFNLNRFFPPT